MRTICCHCGRSLENENSVLCPKCELEKKDQNTPIATKLDSKIDPTHDLDDSTVDEDIDWYLSDCESKMELTVYSKKMGYWGLCPRCGYRYDDNKSSCPNCGCVVIMIAPSVDEIPDSDKYDQITLNESSANQAQAEATQQLKTENKSSSFWSNFRFCVWCAAAAVAFFNIWGEDFLPYLLLLVIFLLFGFSSLNS